MSGIATTDMLALGAYHFPKALLPDDGASALLRLGEAVQGSTLVLYECRLSGEAKPIDISTKYWRHGGGAEALEQLANQMGRGSSDASHIAWQQIETFATNWATNGNSHPALIAVDHIYLEYDCDRHGLTATAPAIFFSFKDGIDQAQIEGLQQVLNPFETDERGFLNVMQSLFESTKRNEGRLGELLGLMLSRDRESRIMIKGDQVEQFVRPLSDIGWSGSIETAASILSNIPVPLKGVRLVVGYGQTWSSDFGFEIFGQTDDEHKAIQHWLSETYPIDRSRINALNDWVGGAGFLHNGRLIHDFTARAMGLDEQDLPTACNKQINHYKLNIRADRVIDVKAYLALSRPAPQPSEDKA